MIRRQPAFFPVYFILIGVLLALTSTQLCSGEGTLALAKRNDNDESLHEFLQVATASLQATGAGIRYLEDKGNTGNKTNDEEGGDADDDDEGGDDDGKQEEAGEAGDESGGNKTSGKVVDKDTEGGGEDDDKNADDESADGASDKQGGGGGGDGDGKPSKDDPDKEKGDGSEADKEDDEQKGTAGEDEGDNDDNAGNNDEEGKKSVEESEDEASSEAKDEDGKAKEASNEGASGNSTPVPPKNDDWEGAYGEPEVGKYIIGFLALIAVIAVYLKFCRGRIGGGGGMISSSSQRPHHGKYETVASDDAEADDWGWDDENGDDDIELAGKPSQPIPSPSGLSLTHRSPSLEGREGVRNAHVNRQKGLHSPPPASPMQQQQQQSMSQMSPSPQMNSPPQMITSLGAPKVPAKKAPARKAQDDDDIFASMGLAAQPKFQTTRPAAKPNSGWGAVAAAPASAPLPKTPVPADSFDAADNWDNDDDLDDLFDD